LGHEVQGVPARKVSHLVETLDGHQGGQRLARPLDDEFLVANGDSIQRVSKSPTEECR
jgi:hypothetical protein